ncbi:MAG TPA: ATP-binding protein [Kofleriaceae bacterium]|jgi:K+-sensing histidine kinase KdpD
MADVRGAGGPRRTPRIDPGVEESRLDAVKKLEILDTPPETSLDDIAQLAVQICGTPIAFVSVIDENRQWFKARVGIGATEIPRHLTICQYVIAREEMLVIDDARDDEEFSAHPFVVGPLQLRFYAGVPLRSNGCSVGTLCVVDREKRVLSTSQINAMQSLARQVEAQLELRMKLREVSALAVEVTRQRDEIAQVQKQNQELVALVVHDLKSPLSSILAESAVHLDKSPNSDAADTLNTISSAARRMHRMTMEMLDVIQGKDGKLELDKKRICIEDVIARARKAILRRAEQHHIEVLQIGADRTFLNADAHVLDRVFENLLDNAIKYGADGNRIEIESQVSGGFIEIRVSDNGRGISPADVSRIFDRNYRAVVDRVDRSDSRGLGLTFCRLAVEAHGGSISVEQNRPRGARFCLRIPVGRGRFLSPVP